MIKFVYFDVGGVLIKDFTASNKWFELAREIGLADEDRQAFIDFWNSREDEICRGRDTEEVFEIAKNKFNLSVPENYSILKDGFLSRLEASESILPIIELAKKKGKVGLLTNMYPGLLDLIFQKGIMPKVEWDIVVDSSLIGLAKPDPKIFEYAQNKCGKEGREILFVENSKRHVDAAAKFGWQAFFYDSSNIDKSNVELEKLLK